MIYKKEDVMFFTKEGRNICLYEFYFCSCGMDNSNILYLNDEIESVLLILFC